MRHEGAGRGERVRWVVVVLHHIYWMTHVSSESHEAQGKLVSSGERGGGPKGAGGGDSKQNMACVWAWVGMGVVGEGEEVGGKA